MKMKKKGVNVNVNVNKEDDQEGMSVQSPCKAQPSSSSSLPPKDESEIEVEIKLLEALEIYPPAKLRGVHRHFVLFGLTEYLRRSLNRRFSPSQVLQLLDRFYNLDMLKADDEDNGILNQEQEFSLPQSYFDEDES